MTSRAAINQRFHLWKRASYLKQSVKIYGNFTWGQAGECWGELWFHFFLFFSFKSQGFWVSFLWHHYLCVYVFQDDLTMSRLILIFLAMILLVSFVQGKGWWLIITLPLSPPPLHVNLMWAVECIKSNFSKTDPYPLCNWEIKRFRLFLAEIHLFFSNKRESR